MKIVWFLDKQLDIAPSSSARIEVIKHLQKNNEVYLVTGYKKNKIQFDELNSDVIYIESPKIPYFNRAVFYFSQIKNFGKLIEVYNPEILLFNTKNFILLHKVSNLKKKYGYKSFLDVRTLPVYSDKFRNKIDYLLFKISLKIASKHFNGITYITEEIRQYCQKKFNLRKHRSGVWGSGMNADLFKPDKRKKDFKSFTLIYHGNIEKNRGLDKVIKAIALLKNYKCKLLLLGSGDGLYELKDLILKLKLKEKVFFYPIVSYRQVPSFINQADVGILPFPDWPSWNTSSPIKLFEYLACGKPVILTKMAAHTNVLRGKDFAFWAERSKPEELAEGIKSAYKSIGDFDRLGKKARDYAIKNFTWKKQVLKLEKFIISKNE